MIMTTFLKLGPIARWQAMGGKELVLRGKPRSIKVEFVSIGGGAAMVVPDGDVSASFTVPIQHGHNVVEWEALGDVSVSYDGEGECYAYTRDCSCTVIDTSAERSFTKPSQRRVRNRELEMMQLRMELNMQARMDAELAELERRYKANPERDPVTNRDIERSHPDVENADAAKGGDEGEPKPSKSARKDKGDPAPASEAGSD